MLCTGAHRPHTCAAPSTVNITAGDKVSVLTRLWGEDYARTVHCTKWATGRTYGTAIKATEQGTWVCDFGEGADEEKAAWEPHVLQIGNRDAGTMGNGELHSSSSSGEPTGPSVSHDERTRKRPTPYGPPMDPRPKKRPRKRPKSAAISHAPRRAVARPEAGDPNVVLESGDTVMKKPALMKELKQRELELEGPDHL